MIYFIIIPLILILDQLSKLTVQRNLYLGESIPVVQDFFHITYIHNYGAAFSFFQHQKFILIVLPVIMIIVIFCYMICKRKSSHTLLMLSLGLIAAGGVGNLIDRLFYGYVVDFIDFRFFPVFNFADISVCCGCGLFLFFMIFLEPKLGDERLLKEKKIEEKNE